MNGYSTSVSISGVNFTSFKYDTSKIKIKFIPFRCKSCGRFTGNSNTVFNYELDSLNQVKHICILCKKCNGKSK